MEKDKRKKWLHIILWGFLDALLIVPVILLLWWFGQLIEEKRQEPKEMDPPAVSWEIPILPSAAVLQGEFEL
ncbi:MAG: hypothetical protein K6A77_06055 [Clostridiales bacterium]|nr:hypothetical protein [Clostridiales bacterium]